MSLTNMFALGVMGTNSQLDLDATEGQDEIGASSEP